MPLIVLWKVWFWNFVISSLCSLFKCKDFNLPTV